MRLRRPFLELDGAVVVITGASNGIGRLTARRLVNNAGVMACGRFDQVPMAAQRQVLATNLLGPVHGASEAMSRFVGQAHGLLVNVSSLCGHAHLRLPPTRLHR